MSRSDQNIQVGVSLLALTPQLMRIRQEAQ